VVTLCLLGAWIAATQCHVHASSDNTGTKDLVLLKDANSNKTRESNDDIQHNFEVHLLALKISSMKATSAVGR